MERIVELIKGETGVDILAQCAHYLGLKRPPSGLESGEALKGFRTSRRLKDRMSVGRELLAPQLPRLLKGQGRLCGRGSAGQITIAEMPLQATDFMHRT